MLEMFSRFVTVGLECLHVCILFSNLHETTLFAFFCACALFQLNPNKRNKQTAVDVKH